MDSTKLDIILLQKKGTWWNLPTFWPVMFNISLSFLHIGSCCTMSLLFFHAILHDLLSHQSFSRVVRTVSRSENYKGKLGSKNKFWNNLILDVILGYARNWLTQIWSCWQCFESTQNMHDLSNGWARAKTLLYANSWNEISLLMQILIRRLKGV